MALSQKLAATALGVLLLGGLVGSGQNRTPGPDQAGIAQTRTMHAEIIRAIETNTRAQIVIARLASHDARIGVAIAQAAEAQRDIVEVSRARSGADMDIQRLTQSLAGLQGERHAAALAEISEKRRQSADLLQQEHAMRGQLTTLQQAIVAEQTRRNESSDRLDELERSLPVR